jgi:hypothetical protein
MAAGCDRSPPESALLHSHHEHRTFRGGDDPFRDAPDRNARQTRPAMRTDDEELRFELVGNFDDLSVGRPMRDFARRFEIEPSEDLLQLLRCLGPPLFDDGGAGARRRPRDSRRVRRGRPEIEVVQNDQFLLRDVAPMPRRR